MKEHNKKGDVFNGLAVNSAVRLDHRRTRRSRGATFCRQRARLGGHGQALAADRTEEGTILRITWSVRFPLHRLVLDLILDQRLASPGARCALLDRNERTTSVYDL